MAAHMANPEVHLPSLAELGLLSRAAEPPLLIDAPSPKPGQMDLLLDGYISHTLTPLCAEKYLKLFIKCLESKRDASLVARDAEWVVVCSKPAQLVHQLQHLHQQQQHQQSKQKRRFGDRHRSGNRALLPPPAPAPPSLIKHHQNDAHPHRTCEEAFDHKVDLDRGTIVPQLTWLGVTEATGVLCPLFFTRRDGRLGVRYAQRDAARVLLREPMALAPELLRRNNQNVRIRIQWPGYKEFHYEFRIMDRKLGEHVPITMYRLVERVARGIHRLYLEGEREPKKFKERWKLGDDDGIQPDDINIIGMLHISRGTWMPILQLDRYIIPRCDHFKEEEEENVVEEESHEDSSPKGADARTSSESPSTASDDDLPMLPTGKEEQKKERKTRREARDPLQQQQ